jgi:hypothetical protein
VRRDVGFLLTVLFLHVLVNVNVLVGHWHKPGEHTPKYLGSCWDDKLQHKRAS